MKNVAVGLGQLPRTGAGITPQLPPARTVGRRAPACAALHPLPASGRIGVYTRIVVNGGNHG